MKYNRDMVAETQLPHNVNTSHVFNKEADILYTAGPYVVQLIFVYDPSIEEELLAYGIYNTVTFVREAEARRLTNAMALADRMWEDEGAFHTAKTQLELFTKEARSKMQ